MTRERQDRQEQQVQRAKANGSTHWIIPDGYIPEMMSVVAYPLV